MGGRGDQTPPAYKDITFERHGALLGTAAPGAGQGVGPRHARFLQAFGLPCSCALLWSQLTPPLSLTPPLLAEGQTGCRRNQSQEKGDKNASILRTTI